MKTLRRLLFLFPIVLACVSTNANAWFFFFLPGSVTSKIGDALSGSEGDSCVKTTAKVGDTINSPTGNSATVKSLSGTSSRCQDPNLPIRALLTFNYSFSSKAGMDIPEGFEQKPLTDMQRYQGFLLKAEHPVKRLNFMVSSQPRTPATEAAALARSIATRMMAAIDDAKGSREEELSIRGMHALRFEVEGKNKGLFGARFTYVVTLLEGSQEMIVVNAWAPTKDDFEKERNELRQLAFRVEGLSSNDAATPSPGHCGLRG